MFIIVPDIPLTWLAEIIHYGSFPGIIVHEIAHRFFCDLFGIPVYKVKYLIFFDKISGYVVHKTPEKGIHHFFIAMGPLIINTLLCALLTFPYMVITPYPDHSTLECRIINALLAVLFWIGISCGAHAFPSDHDVQCLMEYREITNPTFLQNILIIIAYFFVTLCNCFKGLILEWLYTYLVCTTFYHCFF